MWKLFRASKTTKDEKEKKDAKKCSSVNEEYLSAIRTKSYTDFLTKAQLHVEKEPYSPSKQNHEKFSHDILLEPGQEKIEAVIESAILSKLPELKGPILDYFHISAEASKVCIRLLESINQVQHDCRFIQQAVDAIDEYSSPENVKMMAADLRSFSMLSNPFSNPNKHDFKMIHDKYSSVLQHLKLKRKKVAKKIKLIKHLQTSGICVTAACSLITIAAITVAAHTFTLLVMGPGIFSIPFKSFKDKLFSLRVFKSGFLRKVKEQLDVATKGTYILNRDFETMSRLVARIHDDVERTKTMIKFCLEKREDKLSLHLVKELRKCDMGIRKQIQELEEQVYLCLVAINRARALVLDKMAFHV